MASEASLPTQPASISDPPSQTPITTHQAQGDKTVSAKDKAVSSLSKRPATNHEVYEFLVKNTQVQTLGSNHNQHRGRQHAFMAARRL